MSLPTEVEASYVVIIDSILASSDVNTITSKRIRQGLQDAVDYDITPQKEDIKALIMKRFDKFFAEKNTGPTTNGHSHMADPKEAIELPDAPPPGSESPKKRKTESASGVKDEEEEDDFHAGNAVPPKKKQKRKPVMDEDEAFAARLQAEENSRARPTRGGASRKAITPKKKSTPKKKTSSKVKAEDDSDLDGSGSSSEGKKIRRNGAFHKPLTLSPALSSLLDGEVQLSRPQTVKRIWEYVRARDLQDPKDKRQIICDDAMRAVFKSDKVHMFTMNKILGQHLWNPEE